MANFQTFLEQTKNFTQPVPQAPLNGSFVDYLPLLQNLEGGFQKFAEDPGNYNSLGQLVGTNHGISARFYESIIKRPPSESDMRNITKADAADMFRVHFWDACKANLILDQKVANTIVDQHVNAGNGIRLAQEVLNRHFNKRLAVDNVMGNKTLSAINSVSPSLFTTYYNESRIKYYERIGNSKFIDGWLRRVKSFAYGNPSISLGIIGVIFIATVVVLTYKTMN